MRQYNSHVPLLLVAVEEDDFDGGGLQAGRLGETEAVKGDVGGFELALAVNHDEGGIGPLLARRPGGGGEGWVHGRSS